MKSKGFLKSIAAVAGSALLGLTVAKVAVAANPEPVVVEVEWVAAITIAETNPLQFGLLDVAMADTETVVIATDGGVTDANNNVTGGTQAAATFNTTAAPGKAITILVDNIGNGTYYTLGSFTCDYDGDTAGACDGGGLSETSVAGSIEVRVGATLTKNSTPAVAGADNGSFDLTITYQ
ncbi:MAG: DUF4402 domain-containing protein [Woeseiaceae bacterium]|nr:DUF4402 domain-containing protein [Woeseiaceae bacterium]